MKYLALTIPGYGKIDTPANIPSGAAAPSNIIQAVLNLLVVAGVVFALIFILYGGFLWITSQGDKQKIDAARNTITYSIVGIIVIVLSWTIIGIIAALLGAPSALQNFIPHAAPQPIVVPPQIP